MNDRHVPPHGPDGTSSTVEDLQRLAELRDAGVLSEDEFVTAKSNALGLPTSDAAAAAAAGPVPEPPRTRLFFRVAGWGLILLFGWMLVTLVFGSSGDDGGAGTDDSAPNTNPEVSAPPDPEDPPASPVQHTVHSREDVSLGATTRTVLRVQVPAGTTRAELVQLSEYLVDAERRRQPYDALALHYSDIADDGDSPLGWADDAPFGDWSRSSESDGTYATHQLNTSMLREADWSRQPTDQDRDVADINRPIERQEADAGEYSEREERAEAIAEELGMSTDDVLDAIWKVSDWRTGTQSR